MRRAAVSAWGAAVIAIPLTAAATVLPAAAEDPAPPPIAVQLLTPRSSITDDVSLQLRIKHDRHGTRVVDVSSPSRVAVARITVQPGARFPLHTHPGPVVVNVVEGQLTYVDPHACTERAYPAGTAFADSGPDVHTAYGSSPGATTLIATFFGVPATGPLTVPEPVQTPVDCG